MSLSWSLRRHRRGGRPEEVSCPQAPPEECESKVFLSILVTMSSFILSGILYTVGMATAGLCS